MPTRLTGLTLLIVEDEVLVADLIADMIRDHGGRVVGPATSVTDAQTLLRQFRVDGAILDVRLGGHTSLALADELIASGTPVIFAIGYAPSAVPARYASIQRLKKPFRQEEFLEAVAITFSR